MNLLSLAVLLAAPVVDHDVAVRMRDGVTLRADVFRPAASGRFPTLVYRTPYDRRRAPVDYSTVEAAVDRGYAVVVQDVRGRSGSAGEFEPYRNEGKDGYDTIEWAAAQPWSNGKVGTFGLSYPGAVQWLAAVEAPPHLVAMVPAMTFSTARNFIYSGGVFDLSWTSWIYENIAPDVRVKKGLAGPRTEAEAEAAWARLRPEVERRLPLSDLPEFREIAPYLFDWMKRSPGDPAWDWMEIRGKYDRVKAAVLNLSGWHDGAYGTEGAATNHRGLVTARSGRASRSHLVLGPWVHGSATMNAQKGQVKAGERAFAASAAIDYDGLILRFMDHYVRGLDNGVDGEPPVRAFVMGEDVWRDEATWPPAASRPLTLYLRGGAAEGAALLDESAPSERDSTSRFVSDPLDPVTDPFGLAPGAHDYRDLPRHKDLLVFETAPFPRDLRVLGPIRAEVHLSTDTRDTDLWLKLFDVGEDGTAWNLMSPGLDGVRASYRAGGPRHEPLEPGRVYALRFDEMLTGNLFRKGHRLRLVVCATFFPHYSRNLHTGKLETEDKVARKAAIRIHHERAHPSSLTLTVVP
ncbi:MAG TPA: CocE/NonD family hydrolase [Vicinamibacteria bacterium]